MAADPEVMVVAALRTELLFVPGSKAGLGVGRKALTSLLRLLAGRKLKGVVLIGYSGGLRGDLAPGTLLLPDRVLGEEGSVRVGAGILAKAQTLLPKAAVGPIVTVGELSSPEEKARLGIEALGADMESAFLAGELFRKRIPFVIGRVVLDALWEEVPRGVRQGLWAGRALRCSWILGRAVPPLRQAIKEGR